MPHNHIYQNGCATCLVKKYYSLRSSELATTLVLRLSSSEYLPWKNSPDLQQEIRCGQELYYKYLFKTVSLSTVGVGPDVGAGKFPG